MKKLIAIFTLCLLSSFAFSAGPAASIAVSYTHLTLPTKA